MALSRVIAFPPSANVGDAVPLLFVPAASPLNPEGFDIILATPSACAALVALPGSATCNQARPFSSGGALYYYLGRADALGMAAAPACAA